MSDLESPKIQTKSEAENQENFDAQKKVDEGSQYIEHAMEKIDKEPRQELIKLVRSSIDEIEKKYGIEIGVDDFIDGMLESFERNGAQIGVLTAKLKENPQIFKDIVIRRTKEYAIKCADDPVQCVSDIHDKAVDYVWDFIQRSEKEGFKKFPYDMGQATAEALLNIGTIGSINIARISYANPELKRPEEYPNYFAKQIRPKLDEFLSPEGKKQLDVFIKGLSEQISYINLNKLNEIFGAMEQFVKDWKKGEPSSVVIMQRLNHLFLDVAYEKMANFDPRPIMQDLINNASHLKKQIGQVSNEERYTDLTNKFIKKLAQFSIDHQTPLLQTYLNLENKGEGMPRRVDVESAINELIVFRCDYCKDMNNDDFRDMMQYAIVNKINVNSPAIQKLLKV